MYRVEYSVWFFSSLFKAASAARVNSLHQPYIILNCFRQLLALEYKPNTLIISWLRSYVPSETPDAAELTKLKRKCSGSGID